MELEELQKLIRKWIKKEVFPMDQTKEQFVQLLQKSGELGYMSFMYDDEQEWQDNVVSAQLCYLQELARTGNSSLAYATFIQSIAFAFPIYTWGSEEQKQKYLNPVILEGKLASTSLPEIEQTLLTAEQVDEGWKVTGKSSYVAPSIEADFYMFTALNSNNEKVYFIIDKEKMQDAKVIPTQMMGFDQVQFYEIEIEAMLSKEFVIDPSVASESSRLNFSFKEVLDLSLAIIGVGMAQKAYELAKSYANERKQFNQKIATYQTISHRLVEMAVELEACEALIYSKLKHDKRHLAVLYPASTGALRRDVLETVHEITDNAFQIFGGNGYSMEYLIQKLWRDSQQLVLMTCYENEEIAYIEEKNITMNKDEAIFHRKLEEFIYREVTPNIEQWEQDGEVPRDLFEKFGQQGYLGIKFSKQYGGTELGYQWDGRFIKELAKCGSGGVTVGITAHTSIAITAIAKLGTSMQKEQYLQPSIQGEKIAALGITEPHAGSDVASMTTTATREGDYYRINGSKVFITNGVNADYIVLAVKTDPDKGHKGISFFIVDTNLEGISSSKIDKLGWRASDTAIIYLEDVKVPSENLLGVENQGFYEIMKNFQWERVMVSYFSIGIAERSLEEFLQSDKNTIDKEKEISKVKVDIEKAYVLVDKAVKLFDSGIDPTIESTIAKIYATEMVTRITSKILRLMGNDGCRTDLILERQWRDARIMTIGGGTSEIMKEVLVKRLGII
ncbi:acyl-CoA dehydrogenase [Peribacillus butanolivorans]|uniref:acyl-CoA dehydrogenase family protein n=1 Tax=Peribacillus butanolivorans TaxID=421767 RepID=UPI0030C8EF9E